LGYVLLTIKSTNQSSADSVWILILILVIGILFNYSYRLGNIDQYIKTIIEKLSNLESNIENIKKKEVEDKEKKVDPIIIKKELIAPTYLNKENTIPDKVIEKPKISKMMDPREQIKLKEEKNNSDTK
jgi:hypothetical protein